MSSGKHDEDGKTVREPHALRLRFGRGGRIHVDRRRPPRSAARVQDLSRDRLMEEEEERAVGQWRFDEDDGPSMGPEGQEEHDRMLFDDYQAK